MMPRVNARQHLQIGLVGILAMVSGCCSLPDQDVACQCRPQSKLIEAIKWGVIPLQVNMPGKSRVDVPLTPPHPRFHPVPTRDVFFGNYDLLDDAASMESYQAALLPRSASGQEKKPEEDQLPPLPPEPMHIHPVLPKSQMPLLLGTRSAEHR